MTKDEALELCDYLECNDASLEAQCKAAAFIRKALAQPEQEPVGFVDSKLNPIKRPWVGLTDEFYITNMFDMGHYSLQIVFKSRKNADEFKAALQEKNT